jgi:serine-type D-Ala-D-Ala carboxypeptidase
MKLTTKFTDDSRERFAAVYNVLNDAIDGRAFPGCAFGVLAGGEVVLQDALGRFTYDEGAPEMNAETVFDVASLTKVAATTAAAMLLVQRGSLDVDTPLGELLPGFVVGSAGGDQARHVKLGTYWRTIPDCRATWSSFVPQPRRRELMRACLELPLEAEPGMRAEYSDPGFILLGKALEVCMRESLATWDSSRDLCAAGDECHWVLPTACCSAIDSAYRRGYCAAQAADSGRGAGRKCVGAEGTSGHAGLFSNVPDCCALQRDFSQAPSAIRIDGKAQPL